MDLQLKKLAIKKAKQSRCTHRISALGLNHEGICVSRATNVSRFSRKGGGIHAEMRIMAKAKEKGIKTIIICRIGKGGELRPIDPCQKCADTAKKLNIKIITIKE